MVWSSLVVALMIVVAAIPILSIIDRNCGLSSFCLFEAKNPSEWAKTYENAREVPNTEDRCAVFVSTRVVDGIFGGASIEYAYRPGDATRSVRESTLHVSGSRLERGTETFIFIVETRMPCDDLVIVSFELNYTDRYLNAVNQRRTFYD